MNGQDMTPLFDKYQKKILKENPSLQKALKRAENSVAGKGDRNRVKNFKAYDEGYERIKWKSKNHTRRRFFK
jgi:hypothetical protein